jgi:uncharacterized protein YbcI
MTNQAKKFGNECVCYHKYLNVQLSTSEFPVHNENFLNKREYFAGLAMQGILSNSETFCWNDIENNAAVKSVRYAEALLEELTKSE